ncbi:nitrogen fixation protein NifQ [Affinibrenneria salicis]|uniref:Nitrogen fixation protein NifQ n=1 Tax=Affinibrenneria salicis TaxID=2590031 RepID=A0A5J5FUV1_9GAMM|nr:nitrogen fixation protein NifQ [Affinibrenneria salicis]KAA8996899.1 nitrogen fixation protein NifQ [Affinibrenneria salicis]
MITSELWLRRLLSLHDAGKSCLPEQMGLDDDAWRELVRRLTWPAPRPDEKRDRRQALMSELHEARHDEREQLAGWLRQHMAAGAGPMHLIVASASLAFNHLWQDLGLSSRTELRLLMGDCFPPLVAMNEHNMRWKKFFYRQRCLQEEGDLVCRSPTCDDCGEWSLCFAPEA